MSPRVAFLKAHYRRHGLSKGWTTDQVRRLCTLLHIDELELGALFCIEPGQMKRWLKDGAFPAYVSLHFLLLEKWFIHGDKAEPVIPT